MEELLSILRQIQGELRDINCVLRYNADIRNEIPEELKENTLALAKLLEFTLEEIPCN